MLKCLRSLYGKQSGPRSVCSGSTLFASILNLSVMLGPNKIIGVVQVYFLPPTLNFFSPNFEVEKKKIKKMHQNAHLNEKLNFYAFFL